MVSASVLYCAANSFAQYSDSININPHKPRIRKIVDSNLFQETLATTSLIATGFIINDTKNDKFRWFKKYYIPDFSCHIDDYLQFSPAVAMLGLKFAGVESRSSWGRMITSDAFSVSIATVSVNIIKNHFVRWRPDNGGDNSFPSGHTANAFMTATMLTKEYGHKSPWIPISAYTVATATGLMRITNDRHWAGDVLCGAGVGILSTELGYIFADLIFKNKGLSVRDREYAFDVLEKPSFISLFLGRHTPLNGYYMDNRDYFKRSDGCAFGIEGAYFFSQHLGIGARWSVSSAIALEEYRGWVEESLYYANSFALGGYFSYPLGTRWLLGGKLMPEYSIFPSQKYNDTKIPNKRGLGLSTGVSVAFRVKPNYGVKFFADYNLRPSLAVKDDNSWQSMTVGLAFVLFGME